MIKKYCLILISAITLAACGQAGEPGERDGGSETTGPTGPDYLVIGEDLQQLKDDFNANQGRVRLVFLSGPTCGICLRGLADLNDEFIADKQNDDRLVTFVVHVPTMGAKEHHAADSIPLMNGPRVHHYWEESGIIGQHYTEVMDVNMYVWDFWAIYGPDAVWDGTLPPVPEYYEHQLGVTSSNFRGFPKERVLDAERFAAQTRNYLAQVDRNRFPVSKLSERTEGERMADGVVIPHVGQPRNVAVRQHIMGRGGYRNLMRIRSIEARGRIETDGVSRVLTVRSERATIFQSANSESTEPWRFKLMRRADYQAIWSNDCWNRLSLTVFLSNGRRKVIKSACSACENSVTSSRGNWTFCRRAARTGIYIWTAIPAISCGRICWTITVNRCMPLVRAISERHRDSRSLIASSTWMGLEGSWPSR